MNKRELTLLERAFSQEIDAALNNGIGVFQTKSKLAQILVEQGLLKKVKEVLGGRFPVTIEGYALTPQGHLTYCMSCEDVDES